jgi:hypothetical protein
MTARLTVEVLKDGMKIADVKFDGDDSVVSSWAAGGYEILSHTNGESTNV